MDNKTPMPYTKTLEENWEEKTRIFIRQFTKRNEIVGDMPECEGCRHDENAMIEHIKGLLTKERQKGADLGMAVAQGSCDQKIKEAVLDERAKVVEIAEGMKIKLRHSYKDK